MIKIKSSFLTKISIWLILARSPIFSFFMILSFCANHRLFFIFLKSIIPFSLLIFLFVLYSLLQANELVYIFSQAKDILLSMVIFVFLVSYCSIKKGYDGFIFTVIKNGFVFIAVAKIVILAYSFHSGVNPADIIENVSKFWGVEMMTLGIENSSLARVQIPIDTAGPLVIFFTLNQILNNKISLINLLQLFLLVFSCLLTMSRFFWIEAVLFVLVSFIINVRGKKQLCLFSTLFFIIFSLSFLTPLGETVSQILSARFDTLVNTSSDSARFLQTNAIKLAISEYPILGHGIGYYIPQFIRSSEIKYLYENQTLSMVMTLGTVGSFVLFVMISIYVFKKSVIYNVFNKYLALTLLFFLFWLLAGFFNPLLFGAPGGIVLFLSTRNGYIIQDTKEKIMKLSVS